MRRQDGPRIPRSALTRPRWRPAARPRRPPVPPTCGRETREQRHTGQKGGDGSQPSPPGHGGRQGFFFKNKRREEPGLVGGCPSLLYRAPPPAPRSVCSDRTQPPPPGRTHALSLVLSPRRPHRAPGPLSPDAVYKRPFPPVAGAWTRSREGARDRVWGTRSSAAGSQRPRYFSGASGVTRNHAATRRGRPRLPSRHRWPPSPLTPRE